jgi:hypothetical protein
MTAHVLGQTVKTTTKGDDTMEHLKKTHPEYYAGYKSCRDAILSGEIIISDALGLFKIDPPESDFQRGFLLALRQG